MRLTSTEVAAQPFAWWSLIVTQTQEQEKKKKTGEGGKKMTPSGLQALRLPQHRDHLKIEAPRLVSSLQTSLAVGVTAAAASGRLRDKLPVPVAEPKV